MSFGSENVDGAMSGFKVFEAEVKGVDPDTGDLFIASGLDEVNDPEKVPAAYFGGISGTGIFQHPEVGDSVLCTRVYPGGKGITQVLRVIPRMLRRRELVNSQPDENTNAGSLSYPTQGLENGDVRLYGKGGNKLTLEKGNQVGGGVFLGKSDGHGLYVTSGGRENNSTTVVSDSVAVVSCASRTYSRAVHRVPPGENDANTKIVKTNRLKTNIINGGKKRGSYPGKKASNNAVLGSVRNAGLAEYRFVANEIVENDGFEGWDKEDSKLKRRGRNRNKGRSFEDSVSPNGALHLSPNQLVEVVIGNVVNRRGESLDINYNPIIIGSERGTPSGEDVQILMEESRLKSRRGIGYHFQLSKNSLSSEFSNSYDNFIFAVDKEGALKVNVPATTNSGNIMYPTLADFYNEETGRVSSTYSFKRKYEKIPITLKDRESGGGVVYPPQGEVEGSPSIFVDDDEVPRRYVGVRYSNDNNYFKGDGFSGTSNNETDIRVNPTKHHNMYAAAEMLIANTIVHVSIPTDNATCTGYLPGNPVGKAFEIPVEDTSGSFTEIPYMSTVRVKPQNPALNTGGGTIVAGRDRMEEDLSPFSNEFSLSKSGDEITSSNVSRTGEERLDPSGKSANVNLEGSLELSVGKDKVDEKSILLDTAGALVAWLGKTADDKDTGEPGRSLILQTDGSALLNIGGTNGDTFNKGRFDLRVNVTDKGFVGESGGSNSAESDYIISISEHGLVIAGMKKGAPMVIRNEGNLSLETPTKLILSANSIEMREGNRPARKSHKDPVSSDTPDAATLESVGEQITCLMTELSKLTD